MSILLGGVMIALLIPSFHCPAGWELTPVFHVCRTATEIDMHPPTWLAWKFGVAGAAIVLAIVVARWRRVPWPVASVATVAVVGGATWYVTQKIGGGFPRSGRQPDVSASAPRKARGWGRS